jgi:hypothetical protein
MKALRFIAISFLLLSGYYQFLFAQSNSDTIPKFEAGIDFIRFNRNWIYYSNELEPTDGNLYNFDLIPSLFLKLPIKKMALRFKYEFFKKPYSPDKTDDQKSILPNAKLLTLYNMSSPVILCDGLQILLIDSEPFNNPAIYPFTFRSHPGIGFKDEMKINEFHLVFHAGL